MALRTLKQWNQPLTPETLASYGALDFPPPEGPFEPSGIWEQVWQIWLLKPNRRQTNHLGFIRLRRQPGSSAGTFSLHVEQQVINFASLAVQEAELVCSSDATATPRTWTLRFRLLNFSGKALLTEDRPGRGAGAVPGDEPLTSNWSFLEALQRHSAGAGGDVGPFTLLDELDKVEENQRLHFRGERTLKLGGGEAPVRWYERVGAATLPWFYYLDRRGRLLLALSGPTAYILNPHTLEEQRRVLRRLDRRQKRRSK